ncbi:MAG: universal stress protein [Dehalococcoidia bacterium]|nr:universal stress protein [Dehalococcoidia bacterium]
MTTSPTCIIAYTSEDGRYDNVLDAALETARQAEARLILYDIDAAQMFAAPLPTEWSGDTEREDWSALLTEDDLERAGRHPIAQQVRRARSAGVEAFGWLPDKKGADALAEYADKQQADLIMLPADMEEPGLFDRLRKATVKDAVEETQRPVAVVHEDGEVTYP